MKVHFISFASSAFKKSLKRIEDEAIRSGFFNSVRCFKPSDLPLKYRIKNILKLNRYTRGYGYWMWKSYFVKSVLDSIDNEDILIYIDAGCTIYSEGKTRFNEYIKMLISSEFSNLSFQMGHLEKKYTKGDVFKYFGLENDDAMKNSGMLSATQIFLKKNSQSIALVEEWYSICHEKPWLIDDTKSVYANDPEFIDHRHDQSIFSILRKLNGSLMIRDETFFVPYSEDNKKFPFHSTRLR